MEVIALEPLPILNSETLIASQLHRLHLRYDSFCDGEFPKIANPFTNDRLRTMKSNCLTKTPAIEELVDRGTMYTIGELSNSFHISLRTLRFYEQIGLLEPARDGIKRQYGIKDVNRIALIVSLRRYDFAVTSVKETIDAKECLSNSAFATFLGTKLRARREALLSEIEQTKLKIAELEEWIAGVSD